MERLQPPLVQAPHPFGDQHRQEIGHDRMRAHVHQFALVHRSNFLDRTLDYVSQRLDRRNMAHRHGSPVALTIPLRYRSGHCTTRRLPSPS